MSVHFRVQNVFVRSLRVAMTGLTLLITACSASSDIDDKAEELTYIETPPGTGCACSQPVGGVYATFQVLSETFGQQITKQEAIDDVIALWRRQSDKHIPVGQLECSCTGWNCKWNFNMKPDSITMARAATEVCDGVPSYVSENCPSFGNGVYCPFQARLIDLKDCRDPSVGCVPVSR